MLKPCELVLFVLWLRQAFLSCADLLRCRFRSCYIRSSNPPKLFCADLQNCGPIFQRFLQTLEPFAAFHGYVLGNFGLDILLFNTFLKR